MMPATAFRLPPRSFGLSRLALIGLMGPRPRALGEVQVIGAWTDDLNVRPREEFVDLLSRASRRRHSARRQSP
jgi:hypothetical protein